MIGPKISVDPITKLPIYAFICDMPKCTDEAVGSDTSMDLCDKHYKERKVLGSWAE